jgi:small subunit ribosomal protein S14
LYDGEDGRRSQGIAQGLQLPLPPVTAAKKEKSEMAKTSSVEKNNRRRKLADQYAAKRTALKAIIMDQSKPMEERFRAQLKLSALPRNSAKIRIRNRCEVTGRPRAYYRKLKLSRIALRDLGNTGQIPGLVKSSW